MKTNENNGLKVTAEKISFEVNSQAKTKKAMFLAAVFFNSNKYENESSTLSAAQSYAKLLTK